MDGDLKKKLTIAGVIAPFVFIIFFIVVIFVPVASILGIIDTGDGDGSGYSYAYDDYVSTSDNTDYWWPIGSRETITVGDKLFAVGDPASTNITAYFNGNDNVHKGRHSGLDIGAEINVENVIATKSGKVIYPYNDSNISIGTCTNFPNGSDCAGYGNYVKIEHDDGSISIYGHMYQDSITVRYGDVVKQGQVLGKTGSSGNSTGGHLHFEIRIEGSPKNPLEYISADNPRPGRIVNINDANRSVEEIQ